MATSYNDILRSETMAYLVEHVDPLNPPTPQTIEEELLDRVNSVINDENVGRPKRNQLPYLKTLTHGQIAEIMLHLHSICRVAPSGKNTDSDYDLIAMYMVEGEDEGIFITSEEAFRAVARQYNFQLTSNEFREVLGALRDASPRRYRCDDRDLIAVNNGIFNYHTKELEPFTPERLFLAKSHVDFVPDAENPVIVMPDGEPWDVESWMQTLSDDPDIVELLWQILGASRGRSPSRERHPLSSCRAVSATYGSAATSRLSTRSTGGPPS